MIFRGIPILGNLHVNASQSNMDFSRGDLYGGWSKFLVPQITIFADKNVTLANLSRDQSKTLADHNVGHFGGIFLSNA